VEKIVSSLFNFYGVEKLFGDNFLIKNFGKAFSKLYEAFLKFNKSFS
jgi:hypothetical protein